MMKTTSIIITGLGFLLLITTFHKPVLSFFGLEQNVTGMTESTSTTDQNEIMYNVKIKNSFSAPVRLCGGQMNWCGQSGCYSVKTKLPLILEPKQENMIVVSISPREKELAETELVLFADGKPLKGLTQVKIKLPAMSLSSP